MEIQTLKERLDVFEDFRYPIRTDESLDPLDLCITYDQRTTTNLRIGQANNATEQNQ